MRARLRLALHGGAICGLIVPGVEPPPRPRERLCPATVGPITADSTVKRVTLVCKQLARVAGRDRAAVATRGGDKAGDSIVAAGAFGRSP